MFMREYGVKFELTVNKYSLSVAVMVVFSSTISNTSYNFFVNSGLLSLTSSISTWMVVLAWNMPSET